jgi:hypothetical protein
MHAREFSTSLNVPSHIEINFKLYFKKMLECEYWIEQAQRVVKKNDYLQLRVSDQLAIVIVSWNPKYSSERLLLCE